MVSEKSSRSWIAFVQVNIKGTYNLAHAFLPKRNAGSTLIGINAGSIQADAMAKNYSSYNSSKMALLKILQTIADETPDLHVVSLHPGIGMWIVPLSICERRGRLAHDAMAWR